MEVIQKILNLKWTGHEKVDIYDKDWNWWIIGTVINYTMIHKSVKRTKRKNCNKIKLEK